MSWIVFKRREVLELTVSWVALSASFSMGAFRTIAFFKPPGYPHLMLSTFLQYLFLIGLAFIPHELAHKLTAQRMGYLASFRLWPWGLAMAVLTGFLTGGMFVMAAPGAVYILPLATVVSRRFVPDRRVNGLIALAGPSANMALAVAFALLRVPFGAPILSAGLRVNLYLTLFNMLPLPMLDGLKVFSWNKPVWALMTVTPAVWLAFLTGFLRIG